jgi:N-acetylmuramoyl-L-alanine amidase
MYIVDRILKVEVEQPKVETPKVEETKKEETIMAVSNGILIAIDAGHGSNTPGKRTPDGYREHWINVKCANYYEIALKRCGFNTFRVAWDDTDATDDNDIGLTTRQNLIKQAKCKGSVSWHANAHGDGKTYTSGQGIETLYHITASKAKNSKAFAEAVQAELVKGTKQKNRGAKPQSLAMCNCTAMGTNEAILIEVGFMTNEYEKNLLKTDAFCLECAEEAARGTCKYYGVPYVARGGAASPTTSTVVPIINTTEYKVQAGDTLSKIGKAKNIDWKSIAELNGIKSPYHLSVGQIIKLPVAGTVTESTKEEVKVPTKINQSKADIQTFLNKYYGNEIKAVLGKKLTVNGVVDTNTKRALGIAFQVEMNKLGAGLAVDGKIGPASDKAFTKFVGTLKSGSTGIFVTLWQCVLVCFGLNPNGIDGKFGNGCTSATNTLLTRIGLTKDSNVSGSDLNALL